MRQTPLETKITELAQPLAQDLELEIVQVRVKGDGGSKSVQIMAENPETGRLNIDKCASLSRAVSVTLDVEDCIDGKYTLEVSSPGIDRPLVREKDFNRYKGLEVKLETMMPNENGQRRWRGRIGGINEDGMIHLATDEGDTHIEFSALSKAKLVLTDELIKATANK